MGDKNLNASRAIKLHKAKDEQNFIVNHRSGLSDWHESSSSPNYLVPESSQAMRSSFVALGLCTPVAIAIDHQGSIELEMAQRRSLGSPERALPL